MFLTKKGPVHDLPLEAVKFGSGSNGGEALQGLEEPLFQKDGHQTGLGHAAPAQRREWHGRRRRTLAGGKTHPLKSSTRAQILEVRYLGE